MSMKAKLEALRQKSAVKEVGDEDLIAALEQIQIMVEAAVNQEEELKSLKSTVEAQAGELDEVKRQKADPEDEAEKEVKSARKEFKTALKSAHGDIIKGGKLQTKSAFGEAGDIVVTEFSKEITERVLAQSALVGHFGREQASTSAYKKKVAKGGTVASWDGEYASTVPVLVDVAATGGKLTCAPMVEKTVAADAFFDAYAFLQSDALKRVAAQGALALLQGDGVSKPLGLVNHFDLIEGANPVETRNVEIFATIQLGTISGNTIDELRNLVLNVPVEYHGNSRWGMSRSAFATVSELKDGMARGLLQPDPTNPLMFTLFGFPVVMDVTLADDAPIMFGDFDAAFKVLNVPAELDVVANQYRIPGHQVYDITYRVNAIMGANDALIGGVLPVAA
ncbi:phage major capsid protein [Aeromonas media]|uniref:phage major capsid protein n=1 Tax=Aeromonas media TaxID=651 RepID=UPI0038D01C54